MIPTADEILSLRSNAIQPEPRPVDHYALGWMKTFDYKGKTKRNEYWYFQLFHIAMLAALVVILGTGNDGGIMTPDGAFRLGILYGLVTFPTQLSLIVRRLQFP